MDRGWEFGLGDELLDSTRLEWGLDRISLTDKGNHDLVASGSCGKFNIGICHTTECIALGVS